MKKNYNLLKVFSNLFILFILISNFCFSQTKPLNTRLIEPSKTIGYFSNGYVKHLNSKPDEFFLTLSVGGGVVNYFGNDTSFSNSKAMSRISNKGTLIWNAFFENEDSNNFTLNVKKDFAVVDKEDNLIVSCKPNGMYFSFTDGKGNITQFDESTSSSLPKLIFKLDKDGNLLWTKKIYNSGYTSLACDNNNDIYIVGQGSSLATIDNISLGKTYIVKLEKKSGNVIYQKNYDLDVYQFIPVFDSNNNFYVFTEPMNNGAQTSYKFDEVTINSNPNTLDNLMLKFDNLGNVIWGKNFYTNNNVISYSWFNDAVFNGKDFIVMGNLYRYNDLDYLGLDNQSIPVFYKNSTLGGLLAKISTEGNVIWQKPIETSEKTIPIFYTNIDLDSNNNTYGYFHIKGNLRVDGFEYFYDNILGNKLYSKFDTDGNLKYIEKVDLTAGNSKIDVINEDVFNCYGVTNQDYINNYKLENTSNPKFYIATFGNLDSKYLSPQKNYLSLSNLSMSNNPNNDNTFSFDLINNVNWTLESDQSWLNLGFEKLSQKTNSSTLINGTGDSKITMTAETNNTGLSRTANVLVAGDSGVSSSTIIVTQTGTLGTHDSSTFVMTLYPNPTSEVLNIQSQEKISKAEIYDFTGKLLLQTTVIDKKININTLSKGTYFIKLFTGKGIVNSKFIKN